MNKLVVPGLPLGSPAVIAGSPRERSPSTPASRRTPLAGRHRTGTNGAPLVGVAKPGPELLDAHTQEQLADFLSGRPDEEHVIVHLMVPTGWGAQAREAARTDGGSDEDLVVHEADVPGATAPRLRAVSRIVARRCADRYETTAIGLSLASEIGVGPPVRRG